jgi:hypothetical protein
MAVLGSILSTSPKKFSEDGKSRMKKLIFSSLSTIFTIFDDMMLVTNIERLQFGTAADQVLGYLQEVSDDSGAYEEAKSRFDRIRMSMC